MFPCMLEDGSPLRWPRFSVMLTGGALDVFHNRDSALTTVAEDGNIRGEPVGLMYDFVETNWSLNQALGSWLSLYGLSSLISYCWLLMSIRGSRLLIHTNR